MKAAAAALALLLALVFQGTVGFAQDGPLSWRSLRIGDFRAPVPDLESRRQGGGFEAAMSLVSIERQVSFLVASDGTLSEIAVSFTGFFDPDRSWFDRARLPAEAQAALLRHEQGHFDLNELAVRALRMQAERIAGEMERAIAADPAKRRRLAALTAETARLAPDSARGRAAATERIALMEAASPTLQRLLAEAAAAQERYDAETGHGSRPGPQADWEAWIAREIERTGSAGPAGR